MKEELKILKTLKPRRIVYPILIGLAVVSYLIFKDFNKDTFSFFRWDIISILFILVAILMMLVRDVSYMWRIRVLTDYQLSWRKSFDVIMLWEFSSALSPPFIGGVGPAIFFLYKEGINSGKSTAIIIVSILLDELFYLVMVPILYFSIGYNYIFKVDAIKESLLFEYGLSSLLLVGYTISFVYTIMLCYALFVNPYTIKSIISSLWVLSWQGIYAIPNFGI